MIGPSPTADRIGRHQRLDPVVFSWSGVGQSISAHMPEGSALVTGLLLA
ncbi:hypothetical protein [Streptomyces yangpuensis]